MKKINNSRKGLSLVEVLIATGIIAVAVYGLIVSLTMQGIAEAQSRQRQYVRQLHLQHVNAILSGDIDGDDTLQLYFYNAALPGSGRYLQSYSEATHMLTSTLIWSTGTSETLYTSTFSLIYWE